MVPMTTSPDDTPPTSGVEAHGAEEVYIDWLSGDEGESFESLLKRFPNWREELGQLRRWHDRAQGVVGVLRSDARGSPPSEVRAQEPVRYVVGRELGKGGMGQVHEARDTRLDRVLAIKMLRSGTGIADRNSEVRERRRERLLSEARILGQLEHPGIVPVHDAGLDQSGEPYIAMARIRGELFGRIIDQARAGRAGWNLARAVGTLARACEAVSYAHACGVVHRDLKPGNVMIGSFGEVFVMDWGLAKVLRSDPTPAVSSALPTPFAPEEHDEGLTLEGQVLGTPAYMAPEQASGNAAGITPACDVYALGAMLYELLAGRPPFVASDAEDGILARVRSGSHEPLERTAPKAPPELIAIANRAMALRPEDRYASAAALLEDLRAWLEGRPVLAHRTGTLVAARKWVQRNRWLAAALGGVLLALSIAVLTLFHGNRTQRHLNREMEHELYRGKIAHALRALEGNDIRTVRTQLDGCPPELRGWEWHVLERMSDTSLLVRLAHPVRYGARQVDWSPRGDLLATSGSDRRTVLWSTRNFEPQMELEGSHELLEQLSFTGTGKYLVGIGRDARVLVWSPEQSTPSYDSTAEGASWLAAAPEGDTVALGGSDGWLRVYTVEPWRELAAWQGHARQIRFLAWYPGVGLVSADSSAVRCWTPAGQLAWETALPDGNLVALSPDGQTALVKKESPYALLDLHLPEGRRVPWSVLPPRETLFNWGDSLFLQHGVIESRREPGAEPLVLRGHQARVMDVDTEPHGNRLASVSADGTLRVWNLEGRGQRGVVPTSRTTVRRAAFYAPRKVLLGSLDGSLSTLDVNTEGLCPVAQLDQGITALDCSPDGRWFACGTWEGELFLGETEEWTDLRRDDRGRGRMETIAFSPLGATLATTTHDGFVRSWEAQTSELSWETDLGNPALHVTFAPDGRRLVANSSAGLFLLDARTGAVLADWTGPECYIGPAVFSPDGQTVYHGGGRREDWWEYGLQARRVETGEVVWSQAVPSTPGKLAISPDGQRLFLTTSAAELEVRLPQEGQLVASFPMARVGSGAMALSRDGLVLVLGLDGEGLQYLEAAPRPTEDRKSR